MSRPYAFLAANGLQVMANPFNQPVFLVRVKGGEWERQPARSMEDAVRKFISYAGIKSGKVIQALRADQNPATDKPCEYNTARQRRIVR